VATIKPKWVLASAIIWLAIVTAVPQVCEAFGIPVPAWFEEVVGIVGPFLIMIERTFGFVGGETHPPLTLTPPTSKR
jgi:hypothetical protein